MKADLVCEGGGIRGIALLGAITALEEAGYTFEKLAGTSAGALVSSLISVGYSGKELQDILFNLDFKYYIRKSRLSLRPILGESISLFTAKGLFSTNAIENLLTSLYQKKGKEKFKDIAINGESPLKIIATDITKKQLLILPDDLIKYNIAPLEFPIARAVKMSISIPIFFIPEKLKNKEGTSFIVDGGLLSNYPIWLFDTNSIPKWPTFGLKLLKERQLKVNYAEKYKLTTYLLDIIDSALSKNEDIYLSNKDLIRTIYIPTYDVETTDFTLSKESMISLVESGYTSAKKFLQTWNFNNYLARYRS